MNDGQSLMKAILASPEEDTPRLVYADWLDENGQHVRAEFIRLSVAGESDPASANTAKLFLEAHREFLLRVECPACGGGGYNAHSGDPYTRPSKCLSCDGTGDVGGLDSADKTYAHRFPTAFTRGFPYEVGGCRLADIAERVQVSGGLPDSSWEWRPTQWVQRVIQHHPTVQQIPPVDRKPYAIASGRFMWPLDDSALARAGYAASGLPFPLWRLAEPGGRGVTGWESEAKAVEMLARAVVAFARSPRPR